MGIPSVYSAYTNPFHSYLCIQYAAFQCIWHGGYPADIIGYTGHIQLLPRNDCLAGLIGHRMGALEHPRVNHHDYRVRPYRRGDAYI